MKTDPWVNSVDGLMGNFMVGEIYQKKRPKWMQEMGRFPYQPTDLLDPFRVVLGVRSTRTFQVSLRNSPPPMFDVGNSFFFLHAVAAPHNRGKVREGDKYTVYMVNIW